MSAERDSSTDAGEAGGTPAARSAPPEPLRRELSLMAIWLLVINGLIGAGIFGVPAEAARLTGAWSPLMFVLCGLLILPILLCFGELSSYFSGTGGPIRYAEEAFGRLAGFETGWTLYVARMVAFAANVNLLVDSLAYFWAPANQGAARVLLLLAVTGSMTWVNVVGAREAIRSLASLTVLKFLPLVLLVVLGAAQIDAAVPARGAAVPPLRDIGAAALLMIYAYVGFESAVVPAGEARNPARDMPRGLIRGLAVATVLYVLVQAVSMAVLEDLAASPNPLLDVAGVLMGPPGALLLMAGVVVSVGGNLVGSIFSAPRVTYILAREGTLPAWFGEVHPRHGTPHRSIVFYGVAAFGLAALGSFVWLATMTVLVRILLYMVCVAAVPVVRRRYRDRPGSFVLAGGYTLPVIAMIVALWLLWHVSLDAWIVTALFLAAGALLYLLATRMRRA